MVVFHTFEFMDTKKATREWLLKDRENHFEGGLFPLPEPEGLPVVLGPLLGLGADLAIII